MARPPVIQKLRHNRLLCGAVFRWFVETWNWITSYVDNLRGDGDLNGQTGCITIDRTDPDAPVIRIDPNKLPKAQGDITPDGYSTEIAPAGEDSAGKLQIKDWGDQSTYPSGSDTTLADMLTRDPPSQPDAHPLMLLARDGGLLPSTCYIPIGNLTLRRVDSALKVVTAVEWLQGNGPAGHEYSIRVAKQKITIANGELTLDAVKEYSYIDTVAHSAVYPNGN